MRRFILFSATLSSLFFFGASLSAQHKKRSTEEPKSQVMPLPPQLPMAIAADTAALDFHISPLLRTGGLSAQIRQSLNDLVRDTRGETIVKLRAFVAGAGDARRVEATVGEVFTERKLPLPVLSIIQVGALADNTAEVVIEAVVETRRVVNPNGLAFLSGQTGASFAAAIERLKESTRAASVEPDHLLTCTCFTSRLDDYTQLSSTIRSAFPHAGVNIVQALRDPASDSTMCEAVGQLSEPPAESSLIWLKDARATLVNSHRLVFTGLQLAFGNFLDDAHEAFARLERAASSVEAAETPVEVNAFSLDAYAGSALRKMSAVPVSTFTVQTVEGLPSIDASAGIEAIWAPNVRSPVTLAR